MKNIKLPDGYANWLEYSVVHFDASGIVADYMKPDQTHYEQIHYMFDDEPVEKDEVRALVRAEYETLRHQAGLPPSALPRLE